MSFFNETFNNEFFMQLGAFVVAFIFLVVLYCLKKYKVHFGIRVLIAMVLGATVGAIFGDYAEGLKPIGITFVNLIKMIVIPLVVTAIITSFTKLKDTDQLKNLGLKSIAWLLGTTAVATTLALIIGVITKVGSGMGSLGDSEISREVESFADILIKYIIPGNPIKDMADNRMVPVIIFTVIIAVAIIIEGTKNPESVKPFKDLVASFSVIIFRVTKMVLKLTPYGVFGLVLNRVVASGLEALLPLGKYLIVIYIVMIIHFVVVQLGLITFVAKLNPFKFAKKIFPVQVVAFSTQSSYGTLPVTISTLTKKIGVSEKIASFVAPLGANIGMNACGGIYPAIVAVFAANYFGYDLAFADYVLIVLTTTIASIGIAGVPGTASMAATIVLTVLKLPVEAIGLVWAVEGIVDMGRTMINVTGTTVVSTIIAKSEGELDLEIFNSDLTETVEIGL